MENLKLFMILLGAKPMGRNTEQHDVFFGIGKEIKDLVSDIQDFWPDTIKTLHIDAWREVNFVNGYQIKILPKKAKEHIHSEENNNKLYFINLGGYKKGEFEEFHYKMLIVDISKVKAIYKSKQTAFYKHVGFKGAPSHIDDKYGIGVDDLCEVKEILNERYKTMYSISISQTASFEEDELHLGYQLLNKL
jgi:predicted lactoylglutathione lyase